jgi:hypothetical protein
MFLMHGRADELYLKVKGNPKYLYALMVDQTRFWIAQQVADTKYTSNVRPLLENTKELAGKRQTHPSQTARQIFMTHSTKNSSQSTIQEHDIFLIFVCKETTTTTKWSA